VSGSKSSVPGNKFTLWFEELTVHRNLLMPFKSQEEKELTSGKNCLRKCSVIKRTKRLSNVREI
jgi:hypothetical protein